MKRVLTPLFLLSLLALLVAGCGTSTGAAFTGLNVTLAKLERADDGTIHAALRYANPNLAVYNISKAVHRVTLDGVSGTIAIERPFGLPYSSSVEQTGVLQMERGGAPPAAAASLAYRMDTTLTLLVFGAETRVVKTRSSGTVAVTAK